jgi:single-strand DNA-binding protein
MYLNKALICGNVTRDPDLRYIPISGIPVATWTVATNRSWTDENGERHESAEFHHVVVFGKQAEVSATYLKKGQTVLVEGRLQTRSWDADGGKRSRTEIVADRVQFGPKRQAEAPAEGADERLSAAAEDEIPF